MLRSITVPAACAEHYAHTTIVPAKQLDLPDFPSILGEQPCFVVTLMYSEEQANSVAALSTISQVSLEAIQPPVAELSARPGKRDKLALKLVSTATKLRPLFELLDRIQPHLEHDSVRLDSK